MYALKLWESQKLKGINVCRKCLESLGINASKAVRESSEYNPPTIEELIAEIVQGSLTQGETLHTSLPLRKANPSVKAVAPVVIEWSIKPTLMDGQFFNILQEMSISTRPGELIPHMLPKSKRTSYKRPKESQSSNIVGWTFIIGWFFLSHISNAYPADLTSGKEDPWYPFAVYYLTPLTLLEKGE